MTTSVREKTPDLKSRSPVEGVQKTSESTHWAQLDGFRSMCVLMAFIIHAWINPGTKPSAAGLIGYLGVDCFFVLSAFLITSLLVKERAKFGNIRYRDFILKRGLRIWPAYFAMLFFSCFALPLFNLAAFAPEAGQFFGQQFLPCALFYFNISYPFNHAELDQVSNLTGIPIAAALVPFWTLCIEEHFYSTWPAVMKFVRSLSSLKFVLCALALVSIVARCVVCLMALNTVQIDAPFRLYYMNTICHLDPLLIGAFLAIACHQRPAEFTCSTKTGATIFVTLFALLYYLATNLHLHFPTSSPLLMVDMTICSLAAGLMLYLVLAWKPVRNFFSMKSMAYVGKYCFGFYLLHNFIFALIQQQLQDLPLPDVQYSYFAIKCLVGFPVTLLLAILSWKFIESPFLRLRKHFSR